MKGNKTGSIICCSILTILLSILVGYMFFMDNDFETPNTVYQIYLDGEKIGLIENKKQLYELINEEQSEIKDSYNVDQVYPPNGFSIEKYTTYNNDVTTVEDIYQTIKDAKDFTIKGYTITIKTKNTEDKDGKPLTEEQMAPKYIYVVNKEIFDDAIHNFITTFITEEEYEDYVNGTQKEVIETGQIIDNMSFAETITIKESYISVEEKIYTSAEDLTHYLLYGDKTTEEKYVVKKGDTVETISEAHKLNAQEFLIANPDIPDKDTILAIGRKVTIALINPQITLVVDAEVTFDQVIPFESETKVDYSKYYGYRQVIQEGVNGLERNTKIVQIQNGAENSGAYIDKSKRIEIRSPQKQIVVVGNKSSDINVPIDPNASWQWPTLTPYVITSEYGWRWGELHNGMDISGTGKGSPIFSILDGEVVIAQYGGPMGSSAGNNIVIKHDNGYYSVYAHLNSINVQVGQRVTAKQKIGTMGDTGWVTGTHLHLTISIGMPYSAEGYKFLNPRTLWGI